MVTDKPAFPFRSVVIVADVISIEQSVRDANRRDLEQTEQDMLDQLRAAIADLGLATTHYHGPKQLAEHASQHRDDVILTIYGGAVSRNRMALVPAVCETMGLRFIGPDTYGRIICQDKEVSKQLAGEAGLEVAPHRIVRSVADIPKLAAFPVPYVAKPLLEGSSIGIGPDSLVRNAAHGQIVVAEMLQRFGQPVLVEKFIPGREVSYCFVESPNGSGLRSLAEVVWDNRSDYFDYHLYDADHKAEADNHKTVREISSELRATDAAAMEQFLAICGPLGYGRIDGKLHDGRFVFLEITPDAWLGPEGTFAAGFRCQGINYPEVMSQVLLSRRSIPPSQSASD